MDRIYSFFTNKIHGHQDDRGLVANMQPLSGIVDTLFMACKSGNLDSVKQIVEVDGLDVNSIDSNSWSPLQVAAIYGHTDIIEYLVAHNADVLKPTIGGKNALHWAAAYGQIGAVQSLLPHKCNVPIAENGWKAIHFAVGNGHVAIVEMLIASGEERVDDPTNGVSLLRLSVQHKHLEITRLLIEHKANVDAPDAQGDDLLMYSLRYDHCNVLNYLIEHCNVNVPEKSRDEKYLTLLHNGNITATALNLMISGGADVHSNDSEKFRPILHSAVMYYPEIVQRLLQECGCDPNALDQIGNSALHVLLRREYPDLGLLELLVMSGCDLNHKNDSGELPDAEVTSMHCKTKIEQLRQIVGDGPVWDATSMTKPAFNTPAFH